MQASNIDTQITRVPINNNQISEILTQNKLARKQVSLELRTCLLMPPDPLRSGEN